MPLTWRARQSTKNNRSLAAVSVEPLKETGLEWRDPSKLQLGVSVIRSGLRILGSSPYVQADCGSKLRVWREEGFSDDGHHHHPNKRLTPIRHT